MRRLKGKHYRKNYNHLQILSDMNMLEAKQALLAGKVLTHEYFSSGEWVKQEEDEYVMEDGVRCSPKEFWAYRNQEHFNRGWKIFNEANQ